MEAAIVFMFLFAIIFGIFYLFFTTRNKERLALIEKGADATIFFSKKEPQKTAPFWKVVVLNLSLLLMGIGIGVFIALVLHTYTQLEEGAIYPAMIFLMAGAGLFAGFNITKNLDKE
ncbi:DUF6249 domain-containing protein [Tenacibaculum sp. IB213877]|uniref:DUF6249 domain-containing protein n=1 Tax=Tenacibaculum sp. IB213877 TaxID=3097351 RepID=UPI002A5A9342|nr:DUF6249 domain-containing protein [Tenacibaculum sp. IB213877]MDY0779774.1 DUF6249 domain-containing protein [Tenacibaculum sp. IB213877]